MRLILRVRFHTNFGQSLLVTGNHELFGNGDAEKALPLQYVNDELWQTTLLFMAGTAPNTEIVYNYILRNADGSLIWDWGSDKTLNPGSLTAEENLLIDSWNNASYPENAFYTEPFKNVLLKANRTEVPDQSAMAVTHTFKVKAPLLSKGQTLCLLGDTSALASWSTTAPTLLGLDDGEDFFTARVDLSRASFPVAYKYGVFDLERAAFVRFEDGPNRLLSDAAAPHKQVFLNDGFARLPATTWKGAGVSIPIFSLRTEKSFGIGEFTDLKPLADWCQRTGLKLIQILPINDTTATHTWLDSYPYSAISAFALHPIYLNLDDVAKQVGTASTLAAPQRLSEGGGSPIQPLLKNLEPERRRLNALETLDYQAVLEAKLDFLRLIYPTLKAQTLKSKDYLAFFEQNKHWLIPYATFCTLRDKHGTADFNRWSEHELTESTANVDEPEFHFFLQYQLHRQLKEAVEYAHSRGVILKGDIAIGVYRWGADAWQHHDLFNMDIQAGAPPDAFAIKGQNWSFPTYNWPRMKETGFAWWKQRFAQMSCYFDAFRVDHILGFFRIWSIPLHAVEGILGYFVPALPVQLDEFRARNIPFDRNRFLRPHITNQILWNTFGHDQEMIKAQFLNSEGIGNFAFKPEFSTQRQIEAFFQTWDQNEHNAKLKEGLFDLTSNVLLFDAEGSDGRQFHFRFAIEGTPSFKDLAPGTQAQLRDLYTDYFFRRQDDFWRKEALQKLPALKRVTNMLICGEDLGLVPACVPEVMNQIGLLSLEVQRMPKAMGQQFSNPAHAPYLSVVTPSTHDMSTIRGWWEEDRNITQRFYHQQLGLPGEAPGYCEPWINRAIVQQHLASPAMWSIFQFQDLLGMDAKIRRPNPAEERINVPANPKNYWRYRMHLTLESLLQSDAFNGDLKQQLVQHGRA
jgi:4-alpha-glucanotransferase